VSIEITLHQAKALVEFFGGEDARVTVLASNSGKSLLAFCTEHPEEGSVNLGPTRVHEPKQRQETR
jgi:hypothetical protein